MEHYDSESDSEEYDMGDDHDFEDERRDHHLGREDYKAGKP